MKYELLTIGNNTKKGFFIMGNHGQLPETPYYENYRLAMIYALLMAKNEPKKYKTIYNLSENQYRELHV